jgi:hypothetical protein
VKNFYIGLRSSIVAQVGKCLHFKSGQGPSQIILQQCSCCFGQLFLLIRHVFFSLSLYRKSSRHQCSKLGQEKRWKISGWNQGRVEYYYKRCVFFSYLVSDPVLQLPGGRFLAFLVLQCHLVFSDLVWEDMSFWTLMCGFFFTGWWCYWWSKAAAARNQTWSGKIVKLQCCVPFWRSDYIVMWNLNLCATVAACEGTRQCYYWPEESEADWIQVEIPLNPHTLHTHKCINIEWDWCKVAGFLYSWYLKSIS